MHRRKCAQRTKHTPNNVAIPRACPLKIEQELRRGVAGVRSILKRRGKKLGQ